MKVQLKLMLMLGCILAVAGCSGEEKKAETKPAAETPVSTPAEETPAPASDGHEDEVNLGKQTVGTYTVEVIAYGGIKVGTEGHVDIDVDGGSPKAVRSWVGMEDAVGVAKTLADDEGDGHYHGHMEIVEALPDGAKFWVELEEESGELILLSFEI